MTVNDRYQHVVHPFGPLFDQDSRILILGSLPSVMSRRQQFFYGHPQNRFWKLMAALLQEEVPVTIEEKKGMMLKHHVALWDTIYSCDIIGSSDSSIRNVAPTDLRTILDHSNVTQIYCNGRTSGLYFHRYHQPLLGISAEVLPSTSPANAAFSLDDLIRDWSVILESLQ